MSDEQPQVGFKERLMTPEERLKAAQFINSNALDKADPCQVCGGESTIQSSIVGLHGGLDPTGIEGGWVYPSILTICNKCGFTRYFNAIIIGLVPYPPAPKVPDGSDS